MSREFSFVSFILMFCTLIGVAQVPGPMLILRDTTGTRPDLRTIPQNAFGLGERLVYDVGYSFIKAGEAVMTIPSVERIHGRDAYRVVFTVNSTPTFSFFFKVEDKYETMMDVEGLFPWRFSQKIREGNYKRDFEAEFDQVNNIARANDKEYAVPPYVHDVVSAFYFTRTLDFSSMRIGSKISLNNFFKDTTHPLPVKFLGHQQISVPAGVFNCVLIEPLIKEGGLFKSEGRVIIWLTNDERRIPVRVSTKVIIGSIEAELREFSGIRGEVKAKVR
ncbi:MAG: DUF3108 domain-containing protein [Ignavibacteria bacterium]|nr:DUF3108 domain-containing protein [Ignavibacteria bacterium]